MSEDVQILVAIVAGGLLLGLSGKLLLSLLDTSPRRVACLGDSLTADGGYCRELGRILGPSSVVKVFGYPSQGAKYIFGKLPSALAWGPTDLVVLAGVNDLPGANGAEVAGEYLARIYATARNKGIRVVAVKILPWHGYPSAKGRETNTYNLNTWIGHDALVHAVVDPSFLGDENYRLKKEFDAGGGLHLNSAGQKVLGGLIAAQAF